MTFYRLARSLLLGLLGMACLTVAAHADDYPSRPITIIVPFAVGGPTDASARIVAEAITKETGVAVVIQNVPGAGATVGSARAARATPDGYTLLWGSSSSLAITPHLYNNLQYDPLNFVAIGQVVTQPFILVVSRDRGPKTVSELVARGKARANSLNYSSTGSGSSTHLVAYLFDERANITATHVPYNSGAQAVNAVLAGDADFLFDTPTTTVPLVKGGKLTALAVSTASRWREVPDVPTLAEVGFSGFDVSTWFALVAPEGTPVARAAYLSKHLNLALHQDQVVAALMKAGFTVAPSTPIEMTAKIKSENVRWGQVVKTANVKIN